MNDLVVSIIRTVVPAIVGSLVYALANLGIEVDAEGWVALLTSLFIGLYYALARVAESRFPQAGWLLGAPKQPTYGGDN